MPNVYITDDGNSLLYEDERGNNLLKKSLISSVDVVNTGVVIIMKGGQSFIIQKYTDEQNLGSTSAEDLRDKISNLIYASCPEITIGDFVLPGPFYVNQVSQNGSLISGGDPVYTPNLVSGALPDGVSLGIQQAGDDYYITASGVPLEFGDFPITVNVTDGNGCVSTNKALVISVWAVFSSTFGDILPGTNDFTIAVSGMVNPVSADKIASGLLNVTCSNVDDLDIYLDNPGVPPGTGTLVLTGSSSGLSGVDFTNTNFLQGSATSLASGTAPYTGDFNPGWYNGDAGFNLFVGANPNGDWSLQVNNLSGNTYSLVSFTLTFKP